MIKKEEFFFFFPLRSMNPKKVSWIKGKDKGGLRIFSAHKSHKSSSLILSHLMCCPLLCWILKEFNVLQTVSETQMKIVALWCCWFLDRCDKPCLNYRFPAYSIFQPWHLFYFQGVGKSIESQFQCVWLMGSGGCTLICALFNCSISSHTLVIIPCVLLE